MDEPASRNTPLPADASRGPRGQGGRTWVKRLHLLSADEHTMPERVQSKLRARETGAERLIGWIQLALVVFFATLYSLAPRAEGAAGFNFVPLALAAYFLFTVLRVALSYRMVLPGWYLVLSIIVDVALLGALIFSFHIQYAQPATFYLKAPTVMYFFLFIALRALRFDPRLVLVTGLVSVAGWGLLVGYAILPAFSEMRVTRNYVEYLTSNAILLGAELDKSIVLLGVTLLLTLALYRGRQVLVSAVREEAAASDLKRFFAPEVASSITEADEVLVAGRGEVRDVAVLMTDIRGFTRMAATLPPESVMAVLARYQGAVTRLVEDGGGRVDKFLGDGVLATFGAVRPSASAAADALAVGERLPSLFAELSPGLRELGWPEPLRAGAAIAAGPVTVGVVGGNDRLEFTVIGDAVNRAAKLEDANKAVGSTVLTDAETFALARSQGYSGTAREMRGQVTVAGLSGARDLVILA
jgi:adenylate cyclase